MLLTDKTALVTGAANRLGAEIARTLHQNGANLIIHYRSSASAAERLVAELNRVRAGSTVALAADLADDAARDAFADSACNVFGGLDILVNNASTFYPTPFGEIDASAWDDLIASNYRAPLFLAQSCHPALARAGGSIVNLLDIYAERPLARHSVYVSAKAANRMLVKSLALELAPEVRVNGIAPGAILWPEDNDDYAEDRRESLIRQIPLGRTGAPANIAQTALFLATNDYVTGEIIHVDGGRLLR